MISLQEQLKQAPNPQLPLPSGGQWLIILLLLGWLAMGPIGVSAAAAVLPAAWPDPLVNLLSVTFLAGLLLLPNLAFFGLIYWRRWNNLGPFALTLLAITLYIAVAAAIRAITEPGSDLETILRLTLLTAAALVIGGLGLRRAGVPLWMLPHAFGFDRPPVAGLMTALSLIAVVSVGWPLTGALGDSWRTIQILGQSLALTLPEVIFFWGAVIGIITFNFQHRKVLAAFITLLAYLAFIPSMVVPHHEWRHLLLLVTAVPSALLMIELRALSGSIWAGLLFIWAYRAAPLLFTDPRDELPLITQPWQTVTLFWMVAGTAGLVLLLWLGRQFLTPRWRLSWRGTALLALSLAIFLWSVWAILWNLVGYPGFHNDGFLIIMTEQADLSGAEAVQDPVARRAYVRGQLIEIAQKSQAPVRAALDAAGLDYQPYYLINMIRVEGHHRRMAEFSELPGVRRVLLNPNVRPYPFNVSLDYGTTSDQGQGVGWNISQVNADDVWKMGVTGQGIVVAGQDTGYDWTHPALRHAYRGLASGQPDHRFNWHDAWSSSPEPFDDDQHGTHTMGTILGSDQAGNQIGMAPEARWIGCRNMQRGLGNPSSYTECMEFFLAPYPPGGDSFADGDLSKAPHLINNSWGCPDIEGCDDHVLEPAAAALRAAGIMMIVSAGNSGPGCETVSEPPARYDDVFSVGATDSSGRVTGFSSRGPVPNSSTQLLKPDISAPGADIRSSLPGGRYGTADGTSMAGPHVAGLVALIWSANPEIIGQIDATEAIIRRSAKTVEVTASCDIASESNADRSLLEQLDDATDADTCTCGNVEGVPNNVYGWGEIDALEAVELALEYK